MATERRGRVTRGDIEAKLRQIKGEVDSTTTAARPYVAVAVAGAALAVVGVAFLLGQRKGKKKTTVVEVRRV